MLKYNPELQKRITLQVSTEMKYSKTHIRDVVREDLMSSKEITDKIYLCVQSVMKWAEKDHYPSKNERLALLEPETVEAAIIDAMILICSEGRTQALTGVVGRCHHALEYPEYMDNIKTMGEIISHMCEADLINIYPAWCSPIKIKDQGVIAVKPKYGLEEQTVKFIQQSMHLPPMLCKPKTIKTNQDCGYYTVNKPVILKSYNQHNGDVCLDTINLFNSNEYSLDIEFLDTVRDELKPSKKKKRTEVTEQQMKDWEKFQEQSDHVYREIIRQGNSFYLTHHVDARGRTYSKGYHVNPQGKSFKKAMINFKEERTIQVTAEEQELFG